VTLCAILALAGSAAAQNQPDLRARAEAVLHALSSGSADTYEAVAQANFSAAALARRTPEQRAVLVARIASAFGHFEVAEITDAPEGVRAAIRGESGAGAVVTFSFETAPDHRIAAVAFDLSSGPPPPQEVAPSARSYVTTEAMVPVGDHVLSTKLYAPIGRTSFPVVVMLTGSGSESVIDEPYTHVLAQAFAAHGIGCLAYDKAGTGRSTGVLTGTNFEALGVDAAALARYAQRLPQAEAVGFWGLSQVGWVIPYALQRVHGVRFAILVSPAGINPYEQIASFLRGQTLSWGLTPQEADAADRMHRAVALYYAGRASYGAAQAEVDLHRDAPWFHRVVTHPYWDNMTPEGRILAPAQLAAALRDHPEAFETYRAQSSFMDYRSLYRSLRLPTLVIYGASDDLVPVDRSRAVIEPELLRDHRHVHDFRVFDEASHDILAPDGQVRPDYLDAMTTWAQVQFGATR